MNVSVVFDCMIFVQSLISPHGPSAQCLQLAELMRVELWTSATIFDEIKDVIRRPNIVRLRQGLTEETIQRFEQWLLEFCHFTRQVNPRVRLSRDPKDEPYLNLCMTIRSDFLVTLDKDLLTIDCGNHPDENEVRSHLPKLKIVTPRTFLQIIDQEYPTP